MDILLPRAKKPADKIFGSAYYLANRDAILEKNREYRRTHRENFLQDQLVYNASTVKGRSDYYLNRYNNDAEFRQSVIKKSRAFYASLPPKERKEYSAEYYQARKDKFQSHSKKYYAVKKDEIKARSKAYYEANKEAILAKMKARRDAGKATA